MQITLTEKLNTLYLNESQIQIINEYYNNDLQRIDEILTEGFIKDKLDKLKLSYEKNIETVKKVLSDHGVDVGRVERKSKTLASSVKSDVKNRRDPKKVSRKLKDGVVKIIKYEAISVKNYYGNQNNSVAVKALGGISKILDSIYLLILVIIVSSSLWVFSFILFGGPVAAILAPLVIAPIIEEYAKRVAIAEDYPWVYTGIFAGFELLLYVIPVIMSGAAFGPFLILRVMSLVMHFSTTLIQKYFKEKGEEERYKNNYGAIGYFLAVGVHMMWNLMAVVFKEEISAAVGL
jgi:hypothetical protein